MKATHFLIYGFISAVLLVSCNTKNSEQHDQSTVSVSGAGTISVEPDMIQMSISLNKTAQTTRSAQEAVNKMVVRVLDILKKSGIEDKNIRTTSLRFNPEYEYRTNRRVLIGQQAQQSLTFAIHDIRNNKEKASQIIDQLIQINGIELNGMTLDVKDKTDYFIKSRDLAFQKAKQKAEQYAALAGLKVIKVLSLSENDYQQISPISNRLMTKEFADIAEAASTALPTGELEITTQISAVFLLKYEEWK